MATRPERGFRVSDEAHRVTTFELFFDLVFVFAFTQVTHYMAATHSAIGVLQALTILSLLVVRVSYAWLANQTHVDEGLVKLGMSIAMIAMFVVALVIPEAYVDLPGGLYGPLVLVVAYMVVRVTHLTLYYIAAAQDPPLRRQILRTSLALVAGSGFLIAGALADRRHAADRLWLIGLTLDVLLTYVTSTGGNWRGALRGSLGERFGLVVILALGESIVAIGVGAAQEPVSVAIIIGSALAMMLSIALWWIYFDTTALAAERELSRLRGVERAGLAIDGYTYLHLLLISGIVLAALGVEEVIAHVEDAEPLGLFGASALYGGVSCYLAGVAFFWLRVARNVKWLRFGAAVLFLAGVPIAAASAARHTRGDRDRVCRPHPRRSARYAEPRREIREANGHAKAVEADETS